MKNNILLRSEALASLNKDKWGISIGAFLIYVIVTSAVGLIPIIGGVGQLILAGPFLVGYYYFFLKVSRNDSVDIEDLFIAFKSKNQFLASLVSYILFILLIFPVLGIGLTLWAFLVLGRETFIHFIDKISEWSEKLNPANLQSDLPLYDPALTDALSPEINWAFLLLGAIPFILVPAIYVTLSFSQTWFIIANDENISGYNALKESWNLMRGKRLKLFLLELSFIGWAILSVLTLFIGFIFLAPYVQTSYAKFYDNLNESS
tara:strand:- start:371 stop:1156 length:786 start_codon:yes stop_codon:yes gene_type:complete